MPNLRLDGPRWTLDDARAAMAGATPTVSAGARRRVARARAVVDRIVREGRTVYGISTGFGRLQGVAVPRRDLVALQYNLLRSHAAGVGDPLPAEVVRLAVALRARTLSLGHSGVSPRVLRALEALLKAGLVPRVPAQGSVGASGDLAPLAHIALVLVGEGEVLSRDGRAVPAARALRRAGLAPVALGAKDALCLINGTQVTNALGLAALSRADRLAVAADIACALSHEALRGSLRPLLPRVHEVRPHPGQAASAANLRRILRGSRVPASHAAPHGKVQDAYSLRCAPVVHGAARDALRHALETALREADAVTDNPLVFPGEREEIVSAGNFHAEPIALAFDHAAVAAAEIASISERRTESLVNPDLSGGLPAFLARASGLESGCMIVQVTAAALVSENKVLCHPASVDSIPTSAGQEDHVSMGTFAARKFGGVVANAERVVACELYAALDALDLRGGPRCGDGTEAARRFLRRLAPRRRGDRVPSGALERLAAAVADGSLGAAVAAACGPLEGIAPRGGRAA